MNKLFRLTTIREGRVLTLSGWIVLLMTFGSVLFSIALLIYPFLAPTKSVGGDILVVEGWFPDYVLKKVKDRFEKGPYKLLITVGEKYEVGHPLEQYKSAAEATASRLHSQGVPLEIYAFVSDKEWKNYENIVADIFDHLLASLKSFDLELFELPSNFKV